MKARARVTEIMEEEENRNIELRRQEKSEKDKAQTGGISPEEVHSSEEITVGEKAPEEGDISSGGAETSQNVEAEIQRIKKLIWLPPDGYVRFERSCEGCVSKCAEQSLENFQNCQ